MENSIYGVATNICREPKNMQTYLNNSGYTLSKVLLLCEQDYLVVEVLKYAPPNSLTSITIERIAADFTELALEFCLQNLLSPYCQQLLAAIRKKMPLFDFEKKLKQKGALIMNDFVRGNLNVTIAMANISILTAALM